MDLFQNPFYILTATPRDDRRRLMELSDERSLLLDSSDISDACSNLTNPRKRLVAEIAWLPGIAPKRATELLSLLKSSPTELLSIDKLSPIARANLLTEGLSRLKGINANEMSTWIQAIAWSFEDIKPEALRMVINDDRVVSGFSEVSDISVVEYEIQERRRHYRHIIKSALNNLSPKELVKAVTDTVEIATDDGEDHGPILIDDIVDSYEVEAQEFLDKEEENIKTLVERLHGSVNANQNDTSISLIVDQLIQVVKNWDFVAQPIQVSAKSRGLDHEASHRVACIVRNLAIEMVNVHDKIEFSQQLTSMLCEVFAEVGEVAERTADDADTLENIVEERVRLKEEEKVNIKEWAKEITYETDVGAFFKNKLRISPEGIEWKGRSWDLDSITHVRWGGTKHSVNGIPSGTTYNIVFGNRSDNEAIELKKEPIYTNFIDRLWKSVGIRLLTEHLVGLRSGKEYHFGKCVLRDQGMELEREKLFAMNEREFCRWNELEIWNGAGAFCIGKRGDKKVRAALSYQDIDNVHVLEAAIRMFWKKGGDRLSSLLG